jgi:nucleoside-diphosphate-sugar epimerase
MPKLSARKFPQAIKEFLGWIQKKVTVEALLRMVADVFLINIAVLTSLALRLLYIVAVGAPEANINYREKFWEYLTVYSDSFWLLTLICLVVFSMSGFYTYGRFYRGRYKFLVVVQAVSIAYLIFGLLGYLSKGMFFGFMKGMVNFPSGVFIFAWLLTMLLTVTARFWSTMWKRANQTPQIRADVDVKTGARNVLVIGGAGYIGSALLPRLLNDGYHVRVLDLLLYGTEPIAEWLDHPRLEILQADFRQVDRVVEAMRNVDVVIHLGGIVGDPACALDEELTTEINVMATRMIAEVAKGSGVNRFIFASTCSVYGASDHMLDERSELNPVSLYARSKIASEKVLQQMADERFAPVFLRFGTIYGLSGRTRFDLVVNLLTAKAIVDGEITVFGGDQWRPFVHVDDAARVLEMMTQAPLQVVRNEIFNVGSNEQNYTIREIGEIVQSLVPEAKLLLKGDDADRRNYWVNFNKIRNTLNFEPKWTVEQGMQQVIQAIRGGKVTDYRDAKYSNVKFLTEEGMYRLARQGNGWAYQLLNETTGKVMVDL